MSEYNVAIYSDKDFMRKSFVRTENPFTYDCTSSDGAAMLSAFLYSDEIIEYSNTHGGSFRGYKGKCLAVALHFDFDGATSLDDLKNFIERSYEAKEASKDLKVWFSGNKGFHALLGLSMPQIGPSVNTPNFVKEICAEFASRYISWDSSVYDHVRGIRGTNSRHQKSGLFKVELHPTELWSHDIASIRDLAKRPRNLADRKTIHSIIEHNWRMHNV